MIPIQKKLYQLSPTINIDITTTYLVGHLESETICSYEIQ